MEEKEKLILYKQELTSLNEATGEVVSSSITTKRRISKEPEFIKVYLDDIMCLSDLPKSKSDVLYLLLKKMNYENEITIVSRHKKDMAELLNCSIINIDKTLAMLVDKKILFRKDRGIYVANPHLFGKGSWESIEELRLSVEYKKGGKRIDTFVKKETRKLKNEPIVFDDKFGEAISKMLPKSNNLFESINKTEADNEHK